MSNESFPPVPESANQSPLPPPVQSNSGWQRAKFILKAAEVRLRFIGVLVGLGLAIAYWDTIQNYWDRWTRPKSVMVDAGDIEYYCPMHPNVIRDSLDPGGKIPDCPICGMPLSKRTKGETPKLAEGIVARVQLSPERIQLAGVKTESVDYRPLVKEIHTVGFVDFDESKLSQIVSRVKGIVDKLYVDKTFVAVKEGQPVAEIYSPEVYAARQEFFRPHSKSSDIYPSFDARKELRQLGISDQEINTLLNSDSSRPLITIRAPRAGHVIQKNVVVGSAVEQGTTLFEVADLSTVWIEAEVFEKDLAALRTGQDIEATVDALPGEVFRGQVSLVHPHLETATRTNRVRLSLNNAQHKLRPGMFATVVIKTPVVEEEPFRTAIEAARHKPNPHDDMALAAYQKVCPVTGRLLGSMGKPVKTQAENQSVFLCCEGCIEPFQQNPAKYLAKLAPPPAGSVLAVPEQAVIDTGSQTLVYIQREPGVFEGVEVKLGPRCDGYYAVLEGLSPDDQVAAAGAFLVDAETRLNPAAASEYFGASGSGKTGLSTASATPTKVATESMADSARPTAKMDAQIHAPSKEAESSDSASTAPTNGKIKLTAAQLQNIAQLSPTDQQAATKQAVCPISGQPLGSMGKPEKIELDGHVVFLCCPACREDAQRKKDEVLQKLGFTKK